MSDGNSRPGRRSPFPEEQIIAAIRKVRAGERVSVVCREFGISESTLYTWRKRYRIGHRENGWPAGPEPRRRGRGVTLRLALDRELPNTEVQPKR